MSQSIEAIFTGGSFQPVVPCGIGFQEGERVTITVTSQQPPAKKPALSELADKVFEGLSEEDIDDVVRIASQRGDFFSHQ
jgi:predicted DNA-binding antitoxin AbrB/MazE fold protein